jgi:hypothetical protein
MESENLEESDFAEEGDGDQVTGEATPLCLSCMEPVDPLAYYCPNCGGASGQLTEYIPFVNIRWQMGVYGKMWRQMFSHDVSITGKLFRFIMIIWQVPLILIGLLFIGGKKIENQQPQPDEEDGKNDLQPDD